MPDTPALAVSKLTKAFGLRKALRKVSFELPRGSFLSLVGPNGAGKTTLLRILATLARPGTGTAQVLGYDLAKQPNEVRARVGFVSHRSLLYADLSAEENLLFAAKLYGIEAPEKRVSELLATVELTARRHDSVRGFSRGMTQRLSLARALVHNPELLFLDEPYTGLDPHAAQILDKLLGVGEASDTAPSNNRTYCLVSHDVEKGFALASHVLLLARGKLLLFANTGQLSYAEFYEHYQESFTAGAGS